MRVARRAGRIAARAETMRMAQQTDARVVGSVGVTSKSSVCRTRLKAGEPARPRQTANSGEDDEGFLKNQADDVA